ncbi:MAG: plastocyanin/azurin family copper-binding protein, partial [Gemmatimonadota bacterium]
PDARRPERLTRREMLRRAGWLPVALLAACHGEGDSPRAGDGREGGSPGASGSAAGVPTLTGADVVVRIVDNAFVDPLGRRNSEAAVRIRLGQTVGWVHQGAVPHTVTSSTVPEGADPWDSGVLETGDGFRFTPRTAGTYRYFCRLHPAIMRGSTLVAT